MPKPAPLRAACASALAVCALAACASRPANAPVDQVAVTPTTVQIQQSDLSNVNIHLVNEDRAEAHVVKAPLDVVWKALPAVYGELELPVNLYVDKDHQIGSKAARVRGHIGRTRIAQYVSCGTDLTGEDKANTYEVTLDVMSAVGPLDGNQTNVLTRVTASGRPMSTSGDNVRCTSTGAIEKRIATALALRVAAGK